MSAMDRIYRRVLNQADNALGQVEGQWARLAEFLRVLDRRQIVDVDDTDVIIQDVTTKIRVLRERIDTWLDA
jgi:hypothetical protein